MYIGNLQFNSFYINTRTRARVRKLIDNFYQKRYVHFSRI